MLEELRSLVRDDVSDPLLAGARITTVVLSVDYRQARVHYAMLTSTGDAGRQRAQSEQAFVRATPFLRARLADAIDMKRVPDLRFVFDGVVDVDRDGAEDPFPA